MGSTRNMRRLMRVLEHAVRVALRAASNSTSINPGKLAGELEDYVQRLKRLQELGRTQEFYRVFRNAQMKLIDLVRKLLS